MKSASARPPSHPPTVFWVDRAACGADRRRDSTGRAGAVARSLYRHGRTNGMGTAGGAPAAAPAGRGPHRTSILAPCAFQAMRKRMLKTDLGAVSPWRIRGSMRTEGVLLESVLGAPTEFIGLPQSETAPVDCADVKERYERAKAGSPRDGWGCPGFWGHQGVRGWQHSGLELLYVSYTMTACRAWGGNPPLSLSLGIGTYPWSMQDSLAGLLCEWPFIHDMPVLPCLGRDLPYLGLAGSFNVCCASRAPRRSKTT